MGFNAMGNHGKNKIHRMRFNPTGNHGNNQMYRMQFNQTGNYRENPIHDVIQSNNKSWEVKGKTKFIGCDPIQQEIINYD